MEPTRALISVLYFLGAIFNILGKDVFSPDEISYAIMQIYFIAFKEKYNFRNNMVIVKK